MITKHADIQLCSQPGILLEKHTLGSCAVKVCTYMVLGGVDWVRRFQRLDGCLVGYTPG